MNPGGSVLQSGAIVHSGAVLRDPVRSESLRAHARMRPRAAKAAPQPAQPGALVYLRSPGYTERALQFRDFDAGYVANLRAGDLRTQEHFVAYFTELLHLKLRSRLQSPQAIEDVRQETFARVLAALRKEGALRQPERLGAFVNTVCNNVLFEHYRASSRSQSLDDEGQPELPAANADVLGIVVSRQLKAKVREILLDMPERDRSLLKAVFLDERDRDEVCRERGVDREYLRVLLHRAKQVFKTEYIKRMGAGAYTKTA
jgi:RNA polymerase sigma-70 factor, ECF subfamily